jgi:hypothetical protein
MLLSEAYGSLPVFLCAAHHAPGKNCRFHPARFAAQGQNLPIETKTHKIPAVSPSSFR